MTKKEEIKEQIWTIWKISILAKKSFNYSFYLYKPETQEELEFLDHSRDFKFIRHILWRNTVIELSKLFNSSPKRDKFNIFHFIKKLNKDQYYGGLGIEQNKIEEWENKLNENNETIEQIILLRDKFYAHTDNNVEQNNLTTPTFKQTEKLLIIVDNVIQKIYSSIFDSSALTDIPLVKENPSKIIKILANERKGQIDTLRKLLNGENKSCQHLL